MKRFGMIFVVLITMLVALNSYASTIPVDPVWLVDLTGDGEVSLDVVNFVTGYTAGYLDPVLGFSSFPANGTLPAGAYDFAIQNDNNPTTVLSLSNGDGITTFWNSYGDLYHNVSINWDITTSGLPLQLVGATELDALSPHAVPIPATALLFCSSILCIVGIRRKIVT